MKYKCTKDYIGKVASGDTVEIKTGATFEVIGSFIAYDNQGICRVESEFAKEYFEPVLEEEVPQLSPKSALKVNRLSALSAETPAGITIIEVGDCPLSGAPPAPSEKEEYSIISTDTTYVSTYVISDTVEAGGI